MLDVRHLDMSLGNRLSIVVVAVVGQCLVGCATTSTCATGPAGSPPNGQIVQGTSFGHCATPALGQPAVQQGYYPAEAFPQSGSGVTGCAAEGCATEGCVSAGYSTAESDVPRELRKASLPEYRIEPPDVLLIEATNNLRRAGAPILSGEPLIVQVNRTIPYGEDDDQISRQFKTINGPYIIGTDGYVNLGPEYGKVHCGGQPLAEIQRRIDTHLKRILTNPQVLVTLPDPSAKQAVAGQHLVRPDGTVGLGIYGGVYVAGMTLAEAKLAVEKHLSEHMHNPEISVDVLGYNSKVYYVIADGGGAGEQVYRLPSTGNETVLDAIAQIRGLPSVACKGQIWIARPAPGTCRADQVLHIDWNAIAQGAQTSTNYQILPGDRLYVKADRWITFDTNFAKMTAPLERLLGFTILGNGAVRGLSGSGSFGSGGGF